jgi:hypothetical protein
MLTHVSSKGRVTLPADLQHQACRFETRSPGFQNHDTGKRAGLKNRQATTLKETSANHSADRSGDSGECRKHLKTEECGFLPKAATPVLQRYGGRLFLVKGDIPQIGTPAILIAFRTIGL